MKPSRTEEAPGGTGKAAPFAIGYDGSFEGFLCAVAEALNASRAGLPLPAITCPAARADLFDESIAIKTDAALGRGASGNASRPRRAPKLSSPARKPFVRISQPRRIP